MSLPSGYKQLEYIQSSGTQYVNSQFIPNQNTHVVIDFQNLAAAGKYYSIVGAANDTVNNSSYLFLIHDSGVFGYFYGANTYALFSKSVSIANRQVASIIGNRCTVGGETVTASGSLTGCKYPLHIGAYNAGGTTTMISSLRIYACQIYDADELIRDYVPCVDPSGNVGLYDLIGKQFYANAGTGAFTAGPEIPAPEAPTALQTVLAVVLQWAASANADRYDVYRDGAKLGSTTTTQYVDTTAEANQTYVYTVRAANGGGESDGTSITVYTRSGFFEYKPAIESANFR